MKIEITKDWDGNEQVKERNNRVYVSNGRWVWFLTIDGNVESEHDRKRDAIARVRQLETAGRIER